jgi:hypothetical protein
MLAIVEQQQHVSVGDEPQQGIHRGSAWLIRQAQGMCDSDRYHDRIGDRGEVDVPQTVTELRDELRGHLHGESRLARTAGAGQCDQTVVGHTLTYLGHLGVTSDKARQLGRKVLRANGFGRAKWGKLVADIGVTELHHAFGAGQITNRMGAQIGQPCIGWEPVDD